MGLPRVLHRMVLRGSILLCVIGLTVSIYATPELSAQQQPNVTVTFDAQVIDVDVFYLADAAFDLQNLMISPHGPVIFYIHVSSDQSTNIMFGIDIVADTEIAQETVEIFSGLTRPVRLEANRPRYFSSRDLAKGGSLELFQSELIDINGGPAVARRIVEAARATSRLPGGIYYFYLTAFLPGSETAPYLPIVEASPTIVRQVRIINPTRVESLSPADGDWIVTQFPLFQWRSDTRDVVLRVFEMRAGMHSPEEAITGIPHLEQRVSDVNQLIYPQTGAGVRALEPGKRYVWYVEGLYKTSAGREEGIISDLMLFSVLDPGKESALRLILLELEQLLGDEFNIGNIEMIDRIFLDGSEITPEQLQGLIAAIRAGVNNAAILRVAVQE
jgi:hypothetical protein